MNTTTTTRWLSAMALCAISLAGCGGRDARSTQAAQVPAASTAITLRPDPAVLAPAAAAACPPATTAPAAPAPADNARAAVTKAPANTSEKPAKLSIKRLVIAEGVKGREPEGAGTTFKASEADRIYAFLELENESRTDGEVTVAFVPPGGGAPVGNVTLEVGPHPRWRTWAYTRGARKAGEWTAVVRSQTGEVLARTPFEITL